MTRCSTWANASSSAPRSPRRQVAASSAAKARHQDHTRECERPSAAARSRLWASQSAALQLLRHLALEAGAAVTDERARAWLARYSPRTKGGRTAREILAVTGDGGVSGALEP